MTIAKPFVTCKRKKILYSVPLDTEDDENLQVLILKLQKAKFT